jgi:predicted transcriptional regulator
MHPHPCLHLLNPILDGKYGEQILANTLTLTVQDSRNHEKSHAQRFSIKNETLCFESAIQFFGLVTERRWKILELIVLKRELSERQLAQLVGREEQRVRIDVVTLEALGLLIRDDTGWLSCPYESFHIDIRF